MAAAANKLRLLGTLSYVHPTITGVATSALLTLLVIVGSRNLEHFFFNANTPEDYDEARRIELLKNG
jgi:molybdopterin-guanine dinucleotide biosynthesis protein A